MPVCDRNIYYFLDYTNPFESILNYVVIAICAILFGYFAYNLRKQI